VEATQRSERAAQLAAVHDDAGAADGTQFGCERRRRLAAVAVGSRRRQQDERRRASPGDGGSQRLEQQRRGVFKRRVVCATHVAPPQQKHVEPAVVGAPRAAGVGDGVEDHSVADPADLAAQAGERVEPDVQRPLQTERVEGARHHDAGRREPVRKCGGSWQERRLLA